MLALATKHFGRRVVHRGCGGRARDLTRVVGDPDRRRHVHHPVQMDVRRPGTRSGRVGVVDVRPASSRGQRIGIPHCGSPVRWAGGCAVRHVAAVADLGPERRSDEPGLHCAQIVASAVVQHRCRRRPAPNGGESGDHRHADQWHHLATASVERQCTPPTPTHRPGQ